MDDTSDRNMFGDIVVSDKRVKAKASIDKIKELVTVKIQRLKKDKIQLSTLLSHLDDVYEIFVEQAIELAMANLEVQMLKQ